MTIMIEILPPLIVTLAYLVLLRGRQNRYIEAFILLLYIKAFTYFILGIFSMDPLHGTPFDPSVDTGTLLWIIFTDFMFQFVYSLQELLTWIMLSFVSVVFGIIVLIVKMSLQDPVKMKLGNIVKRITGRPPVSDGYTGLSERLRNLRFEGIPEHPLDPELQKKAWSGAWRDYMIIGLATLLPSIPVYMGTFSEYVRSLTDPNYVPPDLYILGVLVFLTWIYRFGYPSSNRVAKAAGLSLGSRNIGAEMMRGVLGWFFRLNILITIMFLAYDVIGAYNTGRLAMLGTYYIQGVIQAAPPILFAIIVLPLAEKFSVILYQRLCETVINFGSKIRAINWKVSIFNVIGALFTGLFGAAALYGATAASTIAIGHKITGLFYWLPNSLDEILLVMLESPNNNSMTILPGIWALLMYAIPFGVMLLIGPFGHYIYSRLQRGMETFALIAGLMTSTLVWFILPGMDYIIAPVVSQCSWNGIQFARVRPIFDIPGTSPEEVMFRLASQFAVNVPIYISTVLFFLYYFEYRRRWMKATGQTTGPLLNVHLSDIMTSIVLFFGGLALSGIVVLALLYTFGPVLAPLIRALIYEISLPDGLEWSFAVLVDFGFLLYVEHNLMRTLLMLVIGPIFWSLVLWLSAVPDKPKSDRFIIRSSFAVLLLIPILAAIVAYLIPSQPDPEIFWYDMSMVALSLYVAVFVGCILVIALTRIKRGAIGSLWFPALLILFVIEYIVYDDQFTIIALVMLSFIITLAKDIWKRHENADQAFLRSYIKFSLISVAIAEVLSTALWLASDGILYTASGYGPWFFAGILPHAFVEIPAFLFAAAASLRVARELWPLIDQGDWRSVPSKVRLLLVDGKLWRTYLLVVFFLVISGLIESNVSGVIRSLFPSPPVP